MIEKNYQPADIESRMAQIWEESGAFRAGRPERKDAATFTIVIPPPNVTGSLHMGHALNNTLQDILCRFERMRGKDVLWQPGTDHAGIATQMVVERQLMERQEPGRRDMGRAKFLERVWQWKAESGDTIINQLKRLGASCDWSRERFTMDEGLSKAVIKVFVELHRQGLIYKDKRLVNWDPKLLTAISDLEVQQVEVKGSLWYLRYPIEGRNFDPADPRSFIVVATTRPETMLGDTGVAVHPEDERYTDLIGKHAILPLVGRKIPIVGDEVSDPDKGSGAVKVTPAHDFTDFEIWTRHREEFRSQKNGGLIDVLSPDATMNSNCPPQYQGLDRYEARKRVVADLEAQGLLEKIEPTVHMVPHGDRSGAVVEPYLTDQWYVDAKALAAPAIEAVRSGRTKFVPENWSRTYFEWMENIQPWCISRQLWWGHQIPAWYGPKVDEHGFVVEGPYKHFVAETEQAVLANARSYYGPNVKVAIGQTTAFDSVVDSKGRRKPEIISLGRDPDVLDTWFSSGLWAFSTLGWPDEAPEVQRYYPTSVLVTGWDIIFFWVARMMMLGIHFMKEVPFSTVYIHRLVRDEKGAKMSKSKGNVIDPLSVIDDYGADALRFALARGAAHSHDIKLSSQLVETNRNFATKLWNAARFVEFNGAIRVQGFDPRSVREPLNRWIVHHVAKAAREVTECLEAYRFNDAAEAAYRFVWNIYCDWYVELSKPILTGPDGVVKNETRATASWTLDVILKLLHPFIPFITEELWQVTKEQGPRQEPLLALSAWPDLSDLEDILLPSEASMDVVLDTVSEARSIRTTYNIQPKEPLVMNLTNFSSANTSVLTSSANSISRLANTVVQIEGTTIAAPPRPEFSVTMPSAGTSISFSSTSVPPVGTHPSGMFVIQTPIQDGAALISMPGSFDADAERIRLNREISKADADIKRVNAKLANEKFVANAPEEIVEEEKEKREAAVARKAKLQEALERLKKAS